MNIYDICDMSDKAMIHGDAARTNYFTNEKPQPPKNG
jgi:hypothetical protein